MKRLQTFAPSLFVLAAMAFGVGPAEAAVASRLVYGRPPGSLVCPDENALRSAVRERLGYDPFFPWAEQTIVVHVAPRANRRLSGKVYLVDGEGHASPEREFVAPAADCGELVLTLVLAIVMTLDPLHGTTVTEAQTSAPNAPVLPPSKPAAAEERVDKGALKPTQSANATQSAIGDRSTSKPVEAVRGARSGPEDRQGAANLRLVALDMGGGALASSGTTPSLSVGFAPWLRARVGKQSLAVEGRFEFPTAVNGLSRDLAYVSLAGGAVVPCIHLGILTPCPVLFMARYRASGVDNAPREATAFFAAAGIRVGVEVPVMPGFWAFVRAESMLNLTRHEITMAGEQLWRIPALSWTLSAGALASIL